MILVFCTKVTQRPLDGLYDVEFRPLDNSGGFNVILVHSPIVGEQYTLKVEGRFPSFSAISDTTEDIIQFQLTDVILGRV